ncbi:hypothetical protein RCC89_05130 [Cytophagaceae bacterium ABcell3]|nr:hypothetical protein RCC89_05130 [Cytophagaceae bacterium ABcell3]
MARLKLKASTIIENVIAMTILSIVSGIALTVFLQVSAVLSSGEVIEAKLILDEYFNKTVREHRVFDEKVSINDFVIDQKVEPYGNPSAQLHQLVIIVYNLKGRKLCEKKEILLVK